MNQIQYEQEIQIKHYQQYGELKQKYSSMKRDVLQLISQEGINFNRLEWNDHELILRENKEYSIIDNYHIDYEKNIDKNIRNFNGLNLKKIEKSFDIRLKMIDFKRQKLNKKNVDSALIYLNDFFKDIYIDLIIFKKEKFNADLINTMSRHTDSGKVKEIDFAKAYEKYKEKENSGGFFLKWN